MPESTMRRIFISSIEGQLRDPKLLVLSLPARIARIQHIQNSIQTYNYNPDDTKITSEEFIKLITDNKIFNEAEFASAEVQQALKLSVPTPLSTPAPVPTPPPSVTPIPSTKASSPKPTSEAPQKSLLSMQKLYNKVKSSSFFKKNQSLEELQKAQLKAELKSIAGLLKNADPKQALLIKKFEKNIDKQAASLAKAGKSEPNELLETILTAMYPSKESENTKGSLRLAMQDQLNTLQAPHRQSIAELTAYTAPNNKKGQKELAETVLTALKNDPTPPISTTQIEAYKKENKKYTSSFTKKDRLDEILDNVLNEMSRKAVIRTKMILD